MRLSFSAFDCYNRCPAQYKFNYIDRVSVPKKIELEFGSLMHSVVELALKRDPIVPAQAELEKFFDENFSKITFDDELKKTQYHQVGREMIRVFHDSLTPGLRSTIATEKRFYIDLTPKHTLSGVIDRIDKLPFGAFEVIDYKTNFKPKTQDEVDRDKQLGIYQIAVNHFWPEAEDIRLSLFFLRTNQKLTTVRVASELNDLKKEIIATCDKIETDTEFKPRRNPLCDWCDYKHLCPLFGGQGSTEIDRKIDDYVRTQEKIAKLEAEINQHFDNSKVDQIESRTGTLIRKNKKFTFKKS
jgi:putative RecB family exonuclease